MILPISGEPCSKKQASDKILPTYFLVPLELDEPLLPDPDPDPEPEDDDEPPLGFVLDDPSEEDDEP